MAYDDFTPEEKELLRVHAEREHAENMKDPEYRRGWERMTALHEARVAVEAATARGSHLAEMLREGIAGAIRSDTPSGDSRPSYRAADRVLAYLMPYVGLWLTEIDHLGGNRPADEVNGETLLPSVFLQDRIGPALIELVSEVEALAVVDDLTPPMREAIAAEAAAKMEAAVRKAITAGLEGGLEGRAYLQMCAMAHREARSAAKAEAALKQIYLAAMKAKAACSTPPADCSNICLAGACDCSGKWRSRAWDLDPARVIEIYQGRGES